MLGILLSGYYIHLFFFLTRTIPVPIQNGLVNLSLTYIFLLLKFLSCSFLGNGVKSGVHSSSCINHAFYSFYDFLMLLETISTPCFQ
jgi:hypothetical protein